MRRTHDIHHWRDAGATGHNKNLGPLPAPVGGEGTPRVAVGACKTSGPPECCGFLSALHTTHTKTPRISQDFPVQLETRPASTAAPPFRELPGPRPLNRVRPGHETVSGLVFFSIQRHEMGERAPPRVK